MKYTQEMIDNLIKTVDGERIIKDVDFTQCDLSFLNLANIKFVRVKLTLADLYNADLRNADLYNANLYNADLYNANLYNADLRNANLRNANLYNANLRNANLYNADLRNADLHNADLYNANLHNANLHNADLRNANLYNANLRNANLHNADLRNAIGNKSEIKSIQLEKYSITFTCKFLQIGCQRFTIEEFKNKTDEEISQMDDGALEWWGKWKNWIFQTIEMSPAVDSNNYPEEE